MQQKRYVEEAWRTKHGGPGSTPSTRALVRLALATAPTDPIKAFSLIADATPLKNSEVCI